MDVLSTFEKNKISLERCIFSHFVNLKFLVLLSILNFKSPSCWYCRTQEIKKKKAGKIVLQ
jgi:hypothetical protein